LEQVELELLLQVMELHQKELLVDGVNLHIHQILDRKVEVEVVLGELINLEMMVEMEVEVAHFQVLLVLVELDHV